MPCLPWLICPGSLQRTSLSVVHEKINKVMKENVFILTILVSYNSNIRLATFGMLDNTEVSMVV
jgi:hypothetical protein